MLDGYVEFLRETWKRFKCDRFVHLGDLIDSHSMSFHERDPDLHSPNDELQKAVAQAKQLYKAFPKAEIITGNHDALVHRQARGVGLPERCIRDLAEIYETPKGWQWHPQFSSLTIDDVDYFHGDGTGRQRGQQAALKNAMKRFAPVVQGHLHTQAGAWFYANDRSAIFGMNVGTGLDHTAREMRYAVSDNAKPVVSCGVVIDGVVPILVRMQL